MQFHTDLSLFDLNGKEVMRKTISVNDPLRFDGITIYQTDWSFSALQIRKDDEGPFNLAMAPLKLNGDKKLFGTFLPVGDSDSPNVKGMYVLFLLYIFSIYQFCPYWIWKINSAFLFFIFHFRENYWIEIGLFYETVHFLF